MLTRRALVAAAALTSVALLAPVAARANHSTPQGPPLSTPLATMDAALSCPGGFTHPSREPVLLVHGTGATPEQNWGSGFEPGLRAAGYDVCTVRLPGHALVDIQLSTEYVVHAIRSMHVASGRLVDVVGHSQGGLQPRWAVKWWPDVLASVDDVVTMGTPNHGTQNAALCTAPFQCPAATWQMKAGARFITALNAGDETPGAASYTNLFTQFDQAVTPPSTSATAGASNILLQDVCPGRPVDHVGMAVDAASFAVVVDALANAGGADRARVPASVCMQFGVPGATYSGSSTNGWMDDWRNGSLASAEPPLKPYAI